MGRLNVVIPDELEKRLRDYLYKKFGYKYYGKISELMERALTAELDRLEEAE